MTTPTTVLVCGSRTWRDPAPIAGRLNAVLAESGPDLIVMHGAASGADAIAGAWAKAREIEGAGVVNEPHPADWQNATPRRAAGAYRNRAMLAALLAYQEAGRRVLLLGFRIDGRSPGTDDMVGLAKRAGIHGYIVTEKAALRICSR